MSVRRPRSALSARAGSVRHSTKASAPSSTPRPRLKSSSWSSPWSRSTFSAPASAGPWFDFGGGAGRARRLGRVNLPTVSPWRRRPHRGRRDTELAGATFGVAERARERSSFHDTVGGPRREPEREDMVRDVERHLRRKAIENLVDLVRHCKFFVLAHRFRGKVPTLPRESSNQKHTLLTIVG